MTCCLWPGQYNNDNDDDENNSNNHHHHHQAQTGNVLGAQDPEGKSLWELTWRKVRTVSSGLTPQILASPLMPLPDSGPVPSAPAPSSSLPPAAEPLQSAATPPAATASGNAGVATAAWQGQIPQTDVDGEAGGTTFPPFAPVVLPVPAGPPVHESAREAPAGLGPVSEGVVAAERFWIQSDPFPAALLPGLEERLSGDPRPVWAVRPGLQVCHVHSSSLGIYA